jgi:peptidoglycan/LPS O-acetylase OafA/YrhL
MSYIAALDGLRAVAILGVLVFHALPSAMRGGFTGVDVFFVLSGYLISSVILHDLREGRFSFGEFYRRRIQRLLPNAVLTVFVTILLSAVVLTPFTALRVAKHGLLTLFNLSNVYVWRNVGGYWGDDAASMPLLHAWSLSVEEQFYLVFPALLWGLARGRRPHRQLLALAAMSLALCLYATARSPTAAFYLLPTRAWELLLGAALAAWRIPLTRPLRQAPAGLRPLRQALGWAGLALIVAGFFLIRAESGFPGALALVPAMGSFGVLVAIADQDGLLARLLATPAAVRIGKLSYSLYLWHWPLIVICRTYAELTNRSPLVGQLVGTLASLPLAALAYRLVERPLRDRGPGRRRRLAAIGAGFAGCAAVCLALAARHPVADPEARFDRLTFRGSLYNVGDLDGAAAIAEGIRIADVERPRRPLATREIWRTGGLIHSWGPGAPRVVLLGSSHALMYAGLIDDICRTLEVPVAFLCADATSAFSPITPGASFPTPALAREFDDARRRWIAAWRPDVLIVVDRWDQYPTTLDTKLRELLGELAPYARHVIVPGQIPALRIGETVNLRDYVTWRLRSSPLLPEIGPDPLEPIRQASLATIAGVARDFPSVELLRVDQPFYNDDGSIRFADGRHFLYADDDHLSDAGAALLRETWQRAIAASTRAP